MSNYELVLKLPTLKYYISEGVSLHKKKVSDDKGVFIVIIYNPVYSRYQHPLLWGLCLQLTRDIVNLRMYIFCTKRTHVHLALNPQRYIIFLPLWTRLAFRRK